MRESTPIWEEPPENAEDEGLKPWAVFWSDDDIQPGVVWEESIGDARYKAERYKPVAAVTREPQQEPTFYRIDEEDVWWDPNNPRDE